MYVSCHNNETQYVECECLTSYLQNNNLHILLVCHKKIKPHIEELFPTYTEWNYRNVHQTSYTCQLSSFFGKNFSTAENIPVKFYEILAEWLRITYLHAGKNLNIRQTSEVHNSSSSMPCNNVAIHFLFDIKFHLPTISKYNNFQ